MGSGSAYNQQHELLLVRWVAQYGDAILRTCFAYLSDASQAEDAMQDTFFKAWKNMDRFEGRNGCNEKTWLMRIAMNTCHDYHRSRWFRHVDLASALEDIPCDAMVPPSDRSLLLEIARLPEKYKQVILLYYYHDMTLQETATVLGIGKSSVHNRLKKAELLLKQTLSGGDLQ